MTINKSRSLVWTIEKIHTQPLGNLQQANNRSSVSQIDLLTVLCVEYQMKGLNAQVNDWSFVRKRLVFYLKNQRINTYSRTFCHYLFIFISLGLRLSRNTTFKLSNFSINQYSLYLWTPILREETTRVSWRIR